LVLCGCAKTQLRTDQCWSAFPTLSSAAFPTLKADIKHLQKAPQAMATLSTETVHTGKSRSMACHSAVTVSSFLVALSVVSCSSVPLKQSGSLSSYNRLGPAEGRLGKSRIFVDAAALSTVTTVAILPSAVSPSAASKVKNTSEDKLVSNALDRALCIGLSDKYHVVRAGEPADLVVRAMITDIVPTGKVAAGISKVTTLGTSAVLPIGIPRLPIGLGGLAVEAEAVDKTGVQRAAIVWARGANSITNSARVSEVGDAYGLAGTFASDFSKMLVKGKRASGISLPSGQKLKSEFGGAPKYAACDAFGRAPGVGGFVADAVGAPPSWTDDAQPH
jgi:hypothetical protein